MGKNRVFVKLRGATGSKVKKTLLIGLIALVATGLIASAGYLGVYSARPERTAVPQKPITVPVERGDVQKTVLAPGTLVNTRRAELSFDVDGKLARVLVRPGDVVRTGDVLVLLERTDLELAVKRAQAELARVEAELAQLYQPALAEEIASAQAAVEDARANLDWVLAGPSQDKITVAKADMEKAAIAVQKAQAEYDQIAWVPGVSALPQAAALQQASIDYERAKANYNLAVQGPTEADIAAARSQLAEAEADLARLLQGPSEAEIAAAQAQVELAQISLEQARKQLERAEITAPFDGVVVKVIGVPSSAVSAGAPVIVVIDSQAMEIEASLVEEDVPLVQPGLPVECFFDARPEDTFAARVDRLVPQRRPDDDRPLYTVYITLDEGADLHSLLPGMTMDASIVLDRRSDVLILPRTLVRARSDGTARIEVWNGTEIETRTIRVGLRGDLHVEVLEGLSEGDEVVQR